MDRLESELKDEDKTSVSVAAESEGGIEDEKKELEEISNLFESKLDIIEKWLKNCASDEVVAKVSNATRFKLPEQHIQATQQQQQNLCRVNGNNHDIIQHLLKISPSNKVGATFVLPLCAFFGWPSDLGEIFTVFQ